MRRDEGTKRPEDAGEIGADHDENQDLLILQLRDVISQIKPSVSSKN